MTKVLGRQGIRAIGANPYSLPDAPQACDVPEPRGPYRPLSSGTCNRGHRFDHRGAGRDPRARCRRAGAGRQPRPPAAPLRAAGEADRGDGEGRPEPAGPDPAALDRRGRRDRGGGPDRARLPAHDEPPGSRTAAGRVGRAARPGGGAGALGARSARRGQPVADRPAAAARGGSRGGAARARGGARRDQVARQPGDARAPLPGPPAPPHRARRPRPGRRRSRARSSRSRARASPPSWSRRATSPTSTATCSWSSTGSPRRRSPTPPATRAPSGSRSALRRAGDGVELDVSDDGRGFAFEESESGLGIAGMRERALLLGGELTIESRPGRGTTVRLRV